MIAIVYSNILRPHLDVRIFACSNPVQQISAVFVCALVALSMVPL